jgi:hypothetical protein
LLERSASVFGAFFAELKQHVFMPEQGFDGVIRSHLANIGLDLSELLAQSLPVLLNAASKNILFRLSNLWVSSEYLYNCAAGWEG